MFKKIIIASIFTVAANNKAMADSQQFRDIFTSVLNESDPAVNVDEVLYGAPLALSQEVFNPSIPALDNLNATDQAFVSYRPLDLYRQGLQRQRGDVSISDINARLTATPVTLVLVPGYLSEFAGTQFAAEAFKQDSILAKTWTAALAANRGADVATDTYYSLGDNSNIQDSLGSVVSVASIDSATGPLVRLIAFGFPEKQTLESVGTIEEISDIYRRRLAKTLVLMDDQVGNLVFVGHSRGAAVALDMLAKAHAANEAWVANVKGVVSCGGVLTGSSAADRTAIVGTLDYANVAANRELANGLRSGSSLNPFVLIANLRAFKRFKSTNEALKAKTTARLNSFFGTSPVHDSKYSGMEAIMDKLSEGLDQSGGGSKALKLKIFIGKTLAGLEGMRTSDRLNWWENNTLPAAGVKYYSVAASMTDPLRSDADRQLVERSPSLVIDSDDFKMGLKSYRSQLLEPSTATFNYDQANSLTDGNVAVQRTIFWPKLIASLNPANQLETEFLGVLGVNHFALAHAKANDDSAPNPFSRIALLKAIAAKAAFDMQ